METSKTKKPQKKIKVIKLKRTPKEWEEIINEARNKELNWKYMKEYYGDELIEKEDETL